VLAACYARRWSAELAYRGRVKLCV
jgi:hypothetical protein